MLFHLRILLIHLMLIILQYHPRLAHWQLPMLHYKLINLLKQIILIIWHNFNRFIICLLKFIQLFKSIKYIQLLNLYKLKIMRSKMLIKKLMCHKNMKIHFMIMKHLKDNNFKIIKIELKLFLILNSLKNQQRIQHDKY